MRLFHDRFEVGTNYGYHIVKKSHNDKLETYHIYFNNQPCLIPTELFTLDKTTAEKIVKLLKGKQNATASRPAHTSRSISSC